MDPVRVARRGGRPPSIPAWCQPLLEEWAGEGLSMRAIATRLAGLDPPVVTSAVSVARRLVRVREQRAAARGAAAVQVEAAKVAAGCPECRRTPLPEAHRCRDGRWRLQVGTDGLVKCPSCWVRQAPRVVLDHVGAFAGLLLPLDDDDWVPVAPVDVITLGAFS